MGCAGSDGRDLITLVSAPGLSCKFHCKQALNLKREQQTDLPGPEWTSETTGHKLLGYSNKRKDIILWFIDKGRKAKESLRFRCPQTASEVLGTQVWRWQTEVTLYGHTKDSVLCFPRGTRMETDQRPKKALQVHLAQCPSIFSYGKSEVPGEE